MPLKSDIHLALLLAHPNVQYCITQSISLGKRPVTYCCRET